MPPSEAVSSLIGGIYDAALEPVRWPGVLGDIARFVGGPAAALYAKNATTKTGDLFYDDGSLDRAYVQLYFERYVKCDPSTAAHFFADVDQPLATSDFIDYEEFLETRFYKEWAQPQGLVDHVTAVLDKTATTVALFGVFRHARDGRVDDGVRRRMRLIAPHVRRAVIIGRVIDWESAQATSLAAVCDGLHAGVFLVDALGRIVHANAAGQGMLDQGDALRQHAGRLAAVDVAADQALCASFVASATGDTALGVHGIALPLTGAGGARYVASVLPLTSGARRDGRSYKAVAALFVQEATMQLPAVPEIIATFYRLTPTELRVLMAVADVGGIPQVSNALGVAETTIKFHMRRLFEKTGARRQADLVKLIAGFATPLATSVQRPSAAERPALSAPSPQPRDEA
jgi:DNA-binding CsgD family transcriptional regulator